MNMWGLFFVFLFSWGIWTIIPADNCERVERAAGPVRGVGYLVQLTVKNWAEPSTNADLARDVASINADAEDLIAQEVYGKGIACHWNKPDFLSSPVTPNNPTTNKIGEVK